MKQGDPPIHYNIPSDDRPGRFVIEMTHRKTGEKQYLGAVPEQTADGDFSNEMFDHLEDASRYPYPSEQTASAVVQSLPDTENIDYAVVEAKGGN